MNSQATLRKAQAVLDAHNNTPNGRIRDADTVLEDLLSEREMEVSGTGAEVIEYYLTAKNPDAFCRLFEAIVGCSFDDYLTKCEEALAGNEKNTNTSMKSLYYIENSVSETGYHISGYFETLAEAKEVLKHCCDWWCHKGTGKIYRIELGLDKHPQLVYQA